MRTVVFGAGGFGREVLTAARGRSAILAGDNPPEGAISPDQITAADEVVIAIADPDIRRRFAPRFKRFGAVIAPTAVIGEDVVIGEGAIFCDFSMVTHSARIGRHFHCNIYSYVAHDCVIGDFVTFAPKVCCNGNVHIGDGAYIGTGAIFRQGHPGKPLVIGERAIVGAGAVVLHDVPAGATVVGSPARIIRQAEAA